MSMKSPSSIMVAWASDVLMGRHMSPFIKLIIIIYSRLRRCFYKQKQNVFSDRKGKVALEVYVNDMVYIYLLI